MPKLPALKAKDVIKIFERAGFVLIRQKGSHRVYVKDKLIIVIPYHNKDLKPKTLRHIIKQSGLEINQFIKLL